MPTLSIRGSVTQPTLVLLSLRHAHRTSAPADGRVDDSARREVGEEDDSGVKPLHVVELHPDGSPVAEHMDVSLAPDERVQVDLVLVDQALLGEGVRELAAPVPDWLGQYPASPS